MAGLGADDAGNFLLLNPPVGADQLLLVDGGPASTPDKSFPIVPYKVTIVAGQANTLGFTPHLHAQKTTGTVAISNSSLERVVTHPGGVGDVAKYDKLRCSEFVPRRRGMPGSSHRTRLRGVAIPSTDRAPCQPLTGIAAGRRLCYSPHARSHGWTCAAYEALRARRSGEGTRTNRKLVVFGRVP